MLLISSKYSFFLIILFWITVSDRISAVQRAMSGHKAICILNGNGITGKVYFTQENESAPTVIKGKLEGLKAGDHGFHIHQYGDLSNGCASAGPHYNPFSKYHGGPKESERHVGDLGNVTANEDGVAEFHHSDHLVKLTGELSVIGRSVVVHADTDDLGKGTGEKQKESQITGNAGARIACGIIALADPTK